MTSLILKNGTKEQFLAYMDRAGQKDAYLCFDQSFRAAEISLDAVLQNGRQLLWTGVAALIVASALAHFLTMRRFAPSAKTMRILGIDRKVVTRQALGAFLTIDALAVILGAGLSAVLFSIITEKHLHAPLPPIRLQSLALLLRRFYCLLHRHCCVQNCFQIYPLCKLEGTGEAKDEYVASDKLRNDAAKTLDNPSNTYSIA